MKHFIPFTETERNTLVNKRKGETKFGEHIKVLPEFNTMYERIKNLDVDFVLFGVSEDIGVYANYGKTGTYKAWNSTIKVLLNIQSNIKTQANRVLILGHLEYPEFQQITKTASKKKHISKARDFVFTIDNDVTYIVQTIIKAGKIPIVIGGGHNNAYGNIKGAALAFNKKINVINFDAHADFRPQEGRHSGNGFSYAFNEGFLKHYFIFGLHENYISDNLFENLKETKQIKYNTYEALEIRNELDFNTELEIAKNYIADKSFGIELDCDAIENIPSSAMSSSGFSTKLARQFIHYFGKQPKACYLHICEAAPTKKTTTKVGKLISYLITDFIRANGIENG